MFSLVTLRNLSWSTADGRQLFEALDLSFGHERTGIVGRNGTGKSTLLKLISGELPLQSGTIRREGRIGILRQIVQVDASETLADMLGIARPLAVIERLLSGKGSAEDAAEADWTLEARLADVLARMGLDGIDLRRPLSSLSGGQQSRAALAALLLEEPDIILLDEPTNNLDRAGRDSVCRLLSEWRGGAAVVSHDRELLSSMDRIMEVSAGSARLYGGNWDFYKTRKAEEIAAAEHALSVAERAVVTASQQAQRMIERQARRNSTGKRASKKAGIGKMAMDAREDRAEKTSARSGEIAERQIAGANAALQEARSAIDKRKLLSFAIDAGRVPHNKVILSFDRVSGGGIDGSVIQDLGFAITGPERIAVTGPNGAGKSTLLKLAAGQLMPSSGTVRRNGHIVMLDQHVSMMDPRLTILENFRRLNPQSGDNACRSALARFLFRNEAALQYAGDLSGGEMLRAGLACLLGGGEPPDLLLLDEPTNHLDLDSVTAVEAALNAYEGALMVVSHDEMFLEAIGIRRRIALQGI